MLIEDSSKKTGLWTKPRPWVFFVLAGLAAWNFTIGPKFFFDLGVQYKERGWIGASRFLMNMSSWCNPWSPDAQRARIYSRARLPHSDIPQEAQSKNIDGFNLDLLGNKDRAREVFADLISQYPNFEWPYNNLANIELEAGNVDKARTLCEKALAINPDYANAHLTLSEVLLREGKADESEMHRKTANELLSGSQ